MVGKVKNTIYDLAIIGAGIIGINALYLAKKAHKAKQIILIDAGQIGKGATYYSAGLDTSIIRSPFYKTIVATSRRLFKEYLTTFPNLPRYNIPILWVVPKGLQLDFKQKV